MVFAYIGVPCALEFEICELQAVTEAASYLHLSHLPRSA